MHDDVFSRIKEALPMADVAEHYGFEVARSGDMLCPFHEDSHPSLHVYPGTRGWWCFVCNEGGSVIDFVSKLFHINARQAAIRLDNDFHLGLTMERPGRTAVSAEIQQRRAEQAAIAAYRAEYGAKCHEAETIRTLPKPPPEVPHDNLLWAQYAGLLGRLDYLDNCWFIQHKWR